MGEKIIHIQFVDLRGQSCQFALTNNGRTVERCWNCTLKRWGEWLDTTGELPNTKEVNNGN